METREECAGGFKKVRETGREKQWGSKTKQKKSSVWTFWVRIKMCEKGKEAWQFEVLTVPGCNGRRNTWEWPEAYHTEQLS